MEEIKSNEFYVCLLSDVSSDVYKSNIQSTFTNLLRTPCNLNEKWQVGLSEIYFNGYTNSPLKRSVNAENFYDEDVNSTLNDEIEVFETNKFKRQKRSTSTEIIINLDDKNYIKLTTKEMNDACYNKRNSDINFSNLVRLLSKKVSNS